MTQRREKEEWFQGVSILDHAVGSIVGEACYNGMSVLNGYTPRRTFNTSSVTLPQLAEVVATIQGLVFKQR